MRHKRKAQRAKPEADHSVLRVLPPSSVPSSDVTQQIIFPPGNALNASPCGNTFSLPNPSRKESIIYIRRSEIQRGGEMSSSFSAPSSYFFLFVSLICLPPVFVFFLLSRLFHSSPPLSERERERREARKTVWFRLTPRHQSSESISSQRTALSRDLASYCSPSRTEAKISLAFARFLS